MGLRATYLTADEDKRLILWVQHKLFSVGSYLATDQTNTTLRIESQIADEDIQRLEKAIDEADALLPPLKAFVIPGGSRGSAVCQVSSTVCRRAERRNLAMAEEHDVTENVSAFVNRLSDFLFVLARKMNLLTQTDEIYWDNSCIRDILLYFCGRIESITYLYYILNLKYYLLDIRIGFKTGRRTMACI